MFETLAIANAGDPAFPPVSKTLRGAGSRYPLGLNESQVPPSDRVRAAIAAASAYANFYPDPTSAELRAALGERLALPVERIVVGAGSEELIFTLALVTGEPGKSIVHCEPCFPSYLRAVALTGAETRRVRIRADGSENVDGMIRALDGSTSMVVATTPSNPAGVMLAAEDVEALADAVPDTALLVIDEAYHEYAVHAGGANPLDVLRRRRALGHWAILRTFSKAYGLAGLRVGYALTSSKAVTTALLKAAPTFNVSRIAQAAALASLEEEDVMRERVAHAAVQRERLKRWCARKGLLAFNSVTNFVSMGLRSEATTAAAVLANNGIVANPWRHPDFADVIRVGVGCAAATSATIAALGLCLTPERRPHEASDAPSKTKERLRAQADN